MLSEQKLRVTVVKICRNRKREREKDRDRKEMRKSKFISFNFLSVKNLYYYLQRTVEKKY